MGLERRKKSYVITNERLLIFQGFSMEDADPLKMEVNMQRDVGDS